METGPDFSRGLVYKWLRSVSFNDEDAVDWANFLRDAGFDSVDAIGDLRNEFPSPQGLSLLFPGRVEGEWARVWNAARPAGLKAFLREEMQRSRRDMSAGDVLYSLTSFFRMK